MAILPIYNCFHPVMREKTEQVVNFDEELKIFIDDMFATLYNTGNGVGLAANQVGRSNSLFVLDARKDENDKENYPILMINPIITSYSDEIISDREGCLSVPDIFEDVPRSKEIEILYYDIDMKEHKKVFSDFVARVIQHEYDHLSGKLFIEKISPLRRTLIKNKLKKIEKGIILGDYSMILANGELVD